MNAKIFLTVSGVIAIAYGLGFLFVPELLASIYGITTIPSTIMEVRFWGATLIGLGIIFLAVRGLTDINALRGTLYGFAISNIAGIWVATTGTLSSTMNSMGWSAVAIYIVLLLGSIWTVAGLSRHPAAA